MKVELARYKKLQKRIQKLGVVIPGTLRVIYQRCGKPSCKCSSGLSKDKHGPYTYWDRKHSGKLTSSSISKKNIKYFKEGIRNRKELDKIYQQMLKIGEKYATKINKQ